jgi:hypothetical protein
VIVLARGVHVEAATQQPALAGAPSWRIHPDQLP